MVGAGRFSLDSVKEAHLLPAVLLRQQAAVGRQTKARVDSDSDSSSPGRLHSSGTLIPYQPDFPRRHALKILDF